MMELTPQIAMLLAILLVAVVSFWWERVSADVTALGVLLALVFAGLLPAERAFHGFGSDTVMMILGLLILTASLQRTGVVDIVGRAVLRRAGDHPLRLLALVMLSAAGLSAFVSNTASTAFFLPLIFGFAYRSGMSPSRLLMPLAFSSILSSSVALVSTSTNVVVSGMMRRSGLEPMGMFELAPVGIPIAVVGLLYMFFIGRRMVPDRSEADLTERFGVRPYLTEIVVIPGSPLIGKTLAQAKIGQALGLIVLHIMRGNDEMIEPDASTRLLEGDVLMVQGSQKDIVKIKDTGGVDIKADLRLSDPDVEKHETALAEAIILPGSPLIGRTLRGYRFRERFTLQVLGLNHRGVNVLRKMSLIPLRLGDVLLLQGRSDVMRHMRDERAFHILGPMETMETLRPKRERAHLAILIFVGVLALATVGLTEFPVAVMLGALLVFATRCISPAEAYHLVDWRVIVMIASLLGLGTAMQETGTADFLAQHIVTGVGDAGLYWLLTGFFVLTVLLTQPMSNQAAAIVILPIAIQTAVLAGLNPRTFAMMVAVAASVSYMTPLEPSCAMVYGPGRYQFRDFVKVGAPLTVLIYIIAIVLVPRVWG